MTVAASTCYTKAVPGFFVPSQPLGISATWLIWGFVASFWQTEVRFHLVKALAKFPYSVKISARVIFCFVEWLSESV